MANTRSLTIPPEHVQEVSRVLRSNLDTIENKTTRQWLEGEIRNLDTGGAGGSNTSGRLTTEDEDRTTRR